MSMSKILQIQNPTEVSSNVYFYHFFRELSCSILINVVMDQGIGLLLFKIKNPTLYVEMI